jgi:hypothetical protein
MPLLNSDVSGQFQYDLQLLDVLSDYRDKLAIEWGSGTRVWVQRAANQPKRVIEIAEQYEPKFPGFRSFTRLVDDVPKLPSGRQHVLRSVKGVYLLVDVETGQQYAARPREPTACWANGWITRPTATVAIGRSKRPARRADGPIRSPCSRWSMKHPRRDDRAERVLLEVQAAQSSVRAQPRLTCERPRSHRHSIR